MKNKPIVKIEKPGEKSKSPKIWNIRVRTHDIKKPDKTHCRFCGMPDDGTAYFHHAEVPYFKTRYGSGMARKVDDNLTVWGHHICGTDASVQPDKNASELEKMEYAWDWAVRIIETHLV